MAVSCPTHFPSEAIILGPTLGDKRTTPLRPEIYPQNLSTQYLVVWGSKKQQGGDEINQISRKGKLF